MKPIYQSTLYAVVKLNGRFAVVLVSRPNVVQYSGAKSFCIDWVRENDL